MGLVVDQDQAGRVGRPSGAEGSQDRVGLAAHEFERGVGAARAGQDRRDVVLARSRGRRPEVRDLDDRHVRELGGCRRCRRSRRGAGRPVAPRLRPGSRSPAQAGRRGRRRAMVGPGGQRRRVSEFADESERSGGQHGHDHHEHDADAARATGIWITAFTAHGPLRRQIVAPTSLRTAASRRAAETNRPFAGVGPRDQRRGTPPFGRADGA